MKQIVIALIALFLFQATASAAPDPSANPVLSGLQKMGAKLFYLGNQNGMDGWFIVKNGQVQIVYANADNKSAIVGAMFGEHGENITAQQIAALVQSNKEIADMIAAAQKEQAAIAQAGAPPKTATASTPVTIPSTAISPGERLIHDLSGAATAVVGNPSSPELLMVMDPHCPHCQATWNALRNDVIKGTLHIRMIPIGTADTDNERAAAMLLGVSDPVNAWDKYVAGDASQLAGTPSPAAMAAIRANHKLIDSWSIQSTPYLVYRAKDGKVKVVVGEPEKISAILTDLGN
jgi:protein-disulfide isomerase